MSPALKQATFGDRTIQSEDGKIILDAPATAEDASLVPITMRVPLEVKDNLKSLTLIIDKNPNWRNSASGLPPAHGDNELHVAIVDTDGALFTAKSQANGS